jgi:hypothetical protein
LAFETPPAAALAAAETAPPKLLLALLLLPPASELRKLPPASELRKLPPASELRKLPPPSLSDERLPAAAGSADCSGTAAAAAKALLLLPFPANPAAGSLTLMPAAVGKPPKLPECAASSVPLADLGVPGLDLQALLCIRNSSWYLLLLLPPAGEA